jgi:hypothetical protein
MTISPFFREFTAPLRHILPIHNVTINSNNPFVNFHWTFTFALRNRMTERTSHLAGLSIGAAISNMSHSKPVLPPSNKHGSHVKDQGQRQCCYDKHKKCPCQPTRDVSLLSGHALYIMKSLTFNIVWLKTEGKGYCIKSSLETIRSKTVT